MAAFSKVLALALAVVLAPAAFLVCGRAASAAPSASPLSPSPLPAATTAAVLARVASYYASAAPFECDFASVTTGGGTLASAASTRLHLSFERPGRFHLESSNGTVMVVDGGVLAVADPHTQQLTRSAVAQDFTPLAFAYAAPDLGSRATFVAYPGGTTSQPGGEVLVGDLPTGTSLGKLVLSVRPSGQVTSIFIHGQAQNRNRTQSLYPTRCTLHAPKPRPSLFAVPASFPTPVSTSPLLGVP